MTVPKLRTGAIVLAFVGSVGAMGAFAQETVFEAPLNPAECGERLIRLYDGDFAQFWNFVGRQGFSGVSEFAWSTPQRQDETGAAWRERAFDCLLEVERANRLDTALETRFAVGYFLWFGTSSLGFEKNADGTAGVRERGYRMLGTAAADGYEPAIQALIQAHLTMVRLADQRVALAAKKDEIVEMPGWWPERDRILTWLDTMAKTGHASAFLAISTIYSERALLPGSTGRDHNGRAVSQPDPRLIDAAKAYRKAWQDSIGQGEES